MVSTDAAKGTLLGLACGDALGRPVEFRSPEQITEQHGTLTDMVGHGTHGQPAGTVTDDTDLALCIARSLVEQAAFDGQDIADRFAAWYDGGPFDIGLMTADAISEYQSGTSWRDAGREVWQRRPEGSNAGNGSIMRCAPHAIAFADSLDSLDRVSKQSSAITHHDTRCQYGCVLLNHIIAGYLDGDDEPVTDAVARIDGDAPDELVETIRLVPDIVNETQLENTGYVVHTLQTSLFDAVTADTAEEAIIASVNRGGDTDTLGAVTGAIAGARFGADALPDRWLDTLEYRDELALLGTALATTEITT
ncbi:ADP-ribosylglycohydrolase family protein [Haloarcula onubensis]|uniref:ADP-ribosylglycohydrolase family protein n=1 Tax=Haloarcula onubensis TaxID=2950539 RepID=A0ABU2FUM9_9EURY|nr:ADP-ribosylglycohydrolase family protein [Halomicroarcula sp. S3CR25-11]MDS0284468.1 ADP-ribosylglycohydrolase family protein [Halomicroarcula sp. S3CR25-11]